MIDHVSDAVVRRAPRERSGDRLARAALASLAVLALVAAFVAGVVVSTRTERVAGAVDRLLISVAGWRASLGRPVPDPAALAANTFAVRTTSPGLTGTVTFALRGTPDVAGSYPARVVTVDRAGRVVWEARGVVPAGLTLLDNRVLPNGNVLVSAADFRDGICSPSERLGWVAELGPDGHPVRELRAPVTHHAEQLPNGNLLLAACNWNQVTEMTWDGRQVWVWRGADHVLPYTPSTYVNYRPSPGLRADMRNMYAEYREGADRDNWLHINSAQRLPNGDTIISLRNLDMLVEVNPGGDIVWTFGGLLLKHQHCGWVLDSGNLLVSDNGNGRIAEFDRATQRLVWDYREGLRFNVQGCAYRLRNGDTMITDADNLRILEVTPDKRVVWELGVQTPGTLGLFRAWPSGV